MTAPELQSLAQLFTERMLNSAVEGMVLAGSGMGVSSPRRPAELRNTLRNLVRWRCWPLSRFRSSPDQAWMLRMLR